MKTALMVIFLLSLAACTTSPKLGDSAVAQVRASVDASDGTIRYTGVAIWIPNSREFRYSAVEPSEKGVAVITDRSFLFQRWGGPTGISTVKRIPFSEIRTAHLETVGRSGCLVIASTSGNFDSFAISDGAGEISIRIETEKMYQVLAPLLKQ